MITKFEESLPQPYSNIYPPDEEECCHHICYTPWVQGSFEDHQPVFTKDQMRDMFHAGCKFGYTSAIEDAYDELRKLGNESKTLKTVFNAIATELKERLK